MRLPVKTRVWRTAGRLFTWSAAAAAGAASSWLLAQALLFLLPGEPPQVPQTARAAPVSLARRAPEKEKPRETPPRPRPEREPKLRDPSAPRSRNSRPVAPPLPALPELEWAAPGPGALPLPLPPVSAPPFQAPSGTGNTGGRGRGKPAEASFHKEPFHWIYAPELSDRDAMERAWPRRALLRGLAGKVTLEVTVGPDLRVRSARVVSARPRGIFEKAAIRMVLRWRGSRPGVFLQPIRFVPTEIGTW